MQNQSTIGLADMAYRDKDASQHQDHVKSLDGLLQQYSCKSVILPCPVVPCIVAVTQSEAPAEMQQASTAAQSGQHTPSGMAKRAWQNTCTASSGVVCNVQIQHFFNLPFALVLLS